MFLRVLGKQCFRLAVIIGFAALCVLSPVAAAIFFCVTVVYAIYRETKKESQEENVVKKTPLSCFDKAANIALPVVLFVIMFVVLFDSHKSDNANLKEEQYPAARRNKGNSDILRDIHNVRMICSSRNGNSDEMPEIKFVKNGKTLISVKSENGSLFFVKELWADKKENRKRLIPGDILPDVQEFDYRKELLDLHGNGDFRYLFIADMHSGNSASGHVGYIIDVKNNFQLVGKVDVGEIIDLPFCNKDLIFNKEILYLGYFGANGTAAVSIPVRYAVGKKPEFLYDRPGINNFADIRKFIKQNINDPEAAVTLLYASLIENGRLKDATREIRTLKYSDHIIEKVHADVIEKIKKSPYRKILERLNNVDVDNI